MRKLSTVQNGGFPNIFSFHIFHYTLFSSLKNIWNKKDFHVARQTCWWKRPFHVGCQDKSGPGKFTKWFLFCTFLCRCFARLQRETSRNFLVTRFVEEMSYEFPFTFFRSCSFSPCNGGLSMFNMASSEDRRIDQCEKLFDSIVSNPDHKLHHFLPSKNYCHWMNEWNEMNEVSLLFKR